MKRFFHSVNEIIFLDGDDIRRAPMAAALFERFARRDPILSAWNSEVRSAGSGKFTKKDAATHPLAKEAMLKMGVDLSSHQAKTITASDIEHASIVLAMEPKHKKYADEHVCIYAGLRARIVPFFDYLCAPDLCFQGLIGSAYASDYIDFAKQIELLFPRVAYTFRQDTYLPLLAVGHGFGAAIIKGKVRNSAGLPRSGQMEKGEILVCNTNHIPGRLPEMAGAIITDSHSELSHLSEIAFEYGIPCVGGTSHATQAILDGETVLVDPSGGAVYGVDEKETDS